MAGEECGVEAVGEGEGCESENENEGGGDFGEERSGRSTGEVAAAGGRLRTLEQVREGRRPDIL